MDHQTGIDYEYRRAWIEQRILALGQIFCIDVCAYAVMSNHYHVVLYINASEQAGLSLEDVLNRWNRLFKGNQLVRQYLNNETLCDAQRQVVYDLAEQWRARLGDISWFMRVLNEGIAREANREDQCTGHFWESRFKSQALLDEQALAACLAYVDLNPVRAQMAETPEQSDYTSAQKRIQCAQQTESTQDHPNQPNTLFPFVGNPRQPMPEGLPFKLEDYLQLLDWTGRILRDDKRGAIFEKAPPILKRLNIDPKNWMYSTQFFEHSFKAFAGTLESVKHACAQFEYKRRPSMNYCLT
jgi:REP element-mobilizing transposase RayT